MDKEKLDKLYEKYVPEEKLLIAKSARKTIRYIEKNTENFPNKYKVLRDKIISNSYDILKNIYRANIFQDINDKKEILTNKKLISYTNYLLELDRMTRSWFKYEKSK